MPYSNQELDNLQALLLSSDTRNVEIAFEMIDAHQIPATLKRPIALLFALRPDTLLDGELEEETLYPLYMESLTRILQEDKLDFLFDYSQELSLYAVNDIADFPVFLKHFKNSYVDYLQHNHHLLGTLVELANDFVNREQYDFAESLYEFIVALGYQDIDTFFNIGFLYQHQLDNPQKAVVFYQKTIDLGGTHHVYHNNLGQVYGEIGAVEKGEYHLKKALEINPDFSPSELALAYQYWKYETRYEEALEKYTELIARNLKKESVRCRALSNCAGLLIDHFDLKKKILVNLNAENLLKEALKIDNTYDYTWKIYGTLYLKKEPINLTEAKRCFELAHKYDPDDEETIALLNSCQ